MSPKPDHSGPKMPGNRETGIVLGIAALAIAMLYGHQGLRAGSPGVATQLLLGVSALLLVSAIVRPALLAPVNRAWMGLAKALHLVVSPIALGAIFYLALTPLAMLRRKQSRKSFPMSPDPDAESYWQPRAPPGPDPKSLNQQF